MNLVVDNTVEETGGEKIEMGMVVPFFELWIEFLQVIRGNSVLMFEPLEKIQ
jgi:hypothetical protein